MCDFSFNVRKMIPEDVSHVLDVRNEEGIEEGTHSIYTWLQCDKNYFCVTISDTGRLNEITGIIKLYFKILKA